MTPTRTRTPSGVAEGEEECEEEEEEEVEECDDEEEEECKEEDEEEECDGGPPGVASRGDAPGEKFLICFHLYVFNL